MLFYLPDAERGYYRGTRFDHSGIIDQMTVDNHRFFTDFRQPHDPLGHDHIPGTAEEFGMDDPLGYEEAQAGDGFVKIGVGILQRANREPYQFHGKYATIELGKWVITNGDRGLSFLGFEQELHGPRGWAYRYVKKFELLKDSHVNGSDGIAPDWIGFKIVRSLTNLGTKPIHTTHYGHNFLRMDDFPPGVGYTLSFPFEPQLDEKFQTQQVVDVVGHDLIFFSDVLKDKAVFGQIIAPADAESRITLQHDKVPYALQITTSRPILKWMLYCHPPAICPEPFIEINVAPHDTFDWETEYRVLRVAKRDRK